ncbi:hypothetical protein KI387_043229, partial [Taxus chinensis]
MPVSKLEVVKSVMDSVETLAVEMPVTGLKVDYVDHNESPGAEKNRGEIEIAENKNRGIINLLDRKEENDEQQQDGTQDIQQEKREKIPELKQNEAENQKEEAVFGNVIMLQSDEYGLGKWLKVREDENHDIKDNKDKNQNNLGGRDPFDAVPEYDGRAISQSSNSNICDAREMGILTHCMFEDPICNIPGECGIALKEAGTCEICNSVTEEPTIEMKEAHHAILEGKEHDCQIVPTDEAGLLLTVAKSEMSMSEFGTKKARAVEKNLGVGFEKKIDDEFKIFKLPINEFGEDLTEIPVSIKGPNNVGEGNICVEKVEIETQLGFQVATECNKQQVGAKIEAAQVVNEEIEISGDIDVTDDETWIILGSNAGNESQVEIDMNLIDELPLFKRDEVCSVQNVYLNLVEVQGASNKECMDEFGEVAQNVSWDCTRSSINILKSNDADLIVYDTGIIKSIDVVEKVNREVKPLEDTQTDQKQPNRENIVTENASVVCMPVGGIYGESIADIDLKQEYAVPKEKYSEAETRELIDVTFAEENPPQNGVCTFGFQIREIIENSGKDFATWSPKPFTRVVDVSSKWINLQDDNTESEEEDDLHAKLTALLASNNPLAPGTDNSGSIYELNFNRKPSSEFNFPTWSYKPVNRVVDVSSKRKVEDDTESEEEDDLHANVTALLASNSPLVLGAAHPAGIGSSVLALESPINLLQHSVPNGFSVREPSSSPMDQINELHETQEKLQELKVKFLRLAHRLCQTPDNFVVGQVLYRLGFAEQLWRSRNSGRIGPFRFDISNLIAQELEASRQEELGFTCTILVIGKNGVGKTATINLIFREVTTKTDAFRPGTKRVQEIVGTVNGIRVRVIDTPGLHVSSADQSLNGKILASIKHFIKKTPPDIVLYVDRLDMLSRGNGDFHLLRTITDAFRPAVWFNAILVLTHAASALPDGPYGIPISYETYVSQRFQVVQKAIRQAVGDMRLVNPVSLVENHPSCRTNRAGQRVLPNGQTWKNDLLLLCFAFKILAEANSLLKLQEDGMHEKPSVTHVMAPPLPSFLYSLLQSRSQLKLPEEQLWDVDVSDDDFDVSSDLEEESEYDKLPPLRSLTRSQLASLDKEQKKAYFDDLDYREKLFMKKQWKEKRWRRSSMKKINTSKERNEKDKKHMEEEIGTAKSIPMPMLDMTLPPSFDADSPAYRYRLLDMVSQWLVQPVLESYGWDHDIGYGGLNLEKTFVIGSVIPVSVSGQVIKGKEEANLQLECAASLKHGEGKMTTARFDIQNIGKEMSYNLHSETRLSNFKYNKTKAGMSFTLLGDTLSAGMKLEDILMIGKKFKVVLNGGAMSDRGGLAYGGNVEATLRDKDYLVGGKHATLGLSIMNWHEDLTIGFNLQSHFAIGRSTTLEACANFDGRGKGQASIRINSLEHLQIAFVGVIPIIKALICHRLLGCFLRLSRVNGIQLGGQVFRMNSEAPALQGMALDLRKSMASHKSFGILKLLLVVELMILVVAREIKDEVAHPMNVFDDSLMKEERNQLGNRWYLYVNSKHVGYLPENLVPDLSKKINRIQYGREVWYLRNGTSHSTTNKGSRDFPDKGRSNAAHIRGISLFM